PPVQRLVSHALPAMDVFAKAAEQSCHLGLFDRGNITVVAQVNGPNNWGMSIRLGVKVNLVDTGSGHALLAFQSDERRAEMLGEHEVLEGEVSVPERDMNRLLARVRKLGYWQGDSQQCY